MQLSMCDDQHCYAAIQFDLHLVSIFDCRLQRDLAVQMYLSS